MSTRVKIVTTNSNHIIIKEDKDRISQHYISKALSHTNTHKLFGAVTSSNIVASITFYKILFGYEFFEGKNNIN